MHSKAYNEFIKKVNTQGYKRYVEGYNPDLLSQINVEEKNEIEQIILKEFHNNDLNMAMFIPKLENIDAISLLEDKAKNVKINSTGYCEIMRILYNETKVELYLDNLIDVLNSKDEDERMNSIRELQKCGKSQKLYDTYKNGCLYDNEEDVRLECVNGMLYCKNIIKNLTSILGKTELDEKWRKLKLKMFDSDEEGRKWAVEEFELLIQ